MPELGYPIELLERAVKQVKTGQSIRTVAQELRLSERVLRYSVKAACLRVQVWAGCAPVVSSAIARFSGQWGPYSSRSKKYAIFLLLREVIDPAVRNYASQLPANHFGLVVGVPGLSTEQGVGALTQRYGFGLIGSCMREALRRFLKLSECQSAEDVTFVATIETLIELMICCASKRPQTSKARDHESLNAQRQEQPLCALCGRPTELDDYLRNGTWPSLDNAQASDKLRLSSRYCSEHRPMVDGVWNASYKRAMRSKARFEVELTRLSRQSCKLSLPMVSTGHRLVDQYVWNYVGHLALYPDERSDLRKHARRMVEINITDRKKQIIMLHALGHNQSEVARQLKMSRQAVSKALKSIPSEFRGFGAS